MLVVLDSGPLGLLSNPSANRDATAAAAWARSLLSAGHQLVIPEIADYEVRRELVRAGRREGVQRLDTLARGLRYEPLTTSAMRRAAELWAEARRGGRPTAPDHALDGDVLLAAQALLLRDDEVVVATTNAKHLRRYVAARRWTDIEA